MPGHLVRRMAQVGASVFVEAAARAGYDLTSVQYAALKAIERYSGIDQTTLAGAIAYDRTTIGGVIDRLEQKKFVIRKVSPNDRRVRQLFLQPSGVEAIRCIDSMVEEVQSAILSGLDTKEKATFLKLLRKAADGANELSRAPLRLVKEP
ncbi:hypothetical protein ASD00_31275 [Ensifer sp. Root31]|nr:MarR family transcriptional regulator [Ensifer sp. Root31]KQU86444.1 hypothetical protein ASD00_31275 [Ensifer sp. Root31]